MKKKKEESRAIQANWPAQPVQCVFNTYSGDPVPIQTSEDGTEGWAGGLTKREWFAGRALQGILARVPSPLDMKQNAKMAVRYADEILRELEIPENIDEPFGSDEE